MRNQGRNIDLNRKALTEALPHANGKLLILIHGLCMNDQQWLRNGHDHGRELAIRLGYTPLYLRYNSGLHISTNGAALSSLLESLVEQWPVPIEELVLLGHSMGGAGRAQRLPSRRQQSESLAQAAEPHALSRNPASWRAAGAGRQLG